MRADEIPDGYRAVRCARCDDHLAVPVDVWNDQARFEQLLVEHHAWLCPNPTDGVRAARRNARDDL